VSPGELERLRRSLLDERSSLEREVASLGVCAPGCEAAEEIEGLLAFLRGVLREVEDALDRMARGTFGLCEACGRPIARERLRALPRARLCVRCQAREDDALRRLRSSGGDRSAA
jgi:RNA polymerase-binding transcription factor DksA